LDFAIRLISPLNLPSPLSLFNPFSPLNPFNPFSPFSPLNPFNPFSPLNLFNPLNPLSLLCRFFCLLSRLLSPFSLLSLRQNSTCLSIETSISGPQTS
jgi:hypothetical protein